MSRGDRPSKRFVPSRRSLLALVASVSAVLVAVVGPTTASAQDPSTTSGTASTDSATAASDAEDTAVLTESRDQVLSRVAGIDTRIRAAEAAAAQAQAQLDAASTRAATAQADADRAAQAADKAAAEVRAYAVEAYVRPPAQDALSTLAMKESRDASYATDVLEIVAERRRRVVDTMVAAKFVADEERAAASTAAAAARAESERAAQEATSLRSARREQSRLAAQLDARLDQKLAEAAALSDLDARTSKELAAQEVALRSSGPAAAPQAGVPVAATRPASTATTTTTPRPVATVPGTPGTTAPPVTTPPVTIPGLVTWADVTKAGGIWVHTSIAGQVAALVSAAKAAGFNLAGGGYRDPASQIALRRAHCGTSDYAIYQMPASQCTPPTAIPGRSMHERGLALDLTSSGRLITSRADPAFAWLAANAARYGFYNLPSEPWHWSTTGH